MTSPSETIAKALAKVELREWFAGGVTDEGLTVVDDGLSHGIFPIRAETHEANFIAACNPVAMREVLDELSALRETALQLGAMKREMAELRAFASSFKLTCVEGSFYKDCYLHINEPDAVSFRLGNGSQFSKFIANLEDRRARTLIQGDKP